MLKHAFALALLALSGCVTSTESGVSVTPAPDEDDQYASVLEAATRSKSVFKDFEARYYVTATYLSPEFRNAFQKRLERVYKLGQVEFNKATGKAGFFVAINSPNLDALDLTDPQHWTILLSTPEGPIKPVLIEALHDKERWRAFFPKAITDWTTDYLVVFDAPSVNPNSPALVAKTPVSLTLANADAQVTLSW
jgi:hypothetical protein